MVSSFRWKIFCIIDVAEYTGISYIDVIQTLSDMQMLEIEDDSFEFLKFHLIFLDSWLIKLCSKPALFMGDKIQFGYSIVLFLVLISK